MATFCTPTQIMRSVQVVKQTFVQVLLCPINTSTGNTTHLDSVVVSLLLSHNSAVSKVLDHLD